jgi:hypothetical protein
VYSPPQHVGDLQNGATESCKQETSELLVNYVNALTLSYSSSAVHYRASSTWRSRLSLLHYKFHNPK